MTPVQTGQPHRDRSRFGYMGNDAVPTCTTYDDRRFEFSDGVGAGVLAADGHGGVAVRAARTTALPLGDVLVWLGDQHARAHPPPSPETEPIRVRTMADVPALADVRSRLANLDHLSQVTRNPDHTGERDALSWLEVALVRVRELEAET